MRVRALALRLHPLVGVLTGAALLVLGLSGAVLVLRPDFESSQSAGLTRAPSGGSAPSLDALLEAARRRHPGFLVTSLSLPGGGAAARVGMLDTAGGALEVLIDPRSGRIVSSSWAERSPLHASGFSTPSSTWARADARSWAFSVSGSCSKGLRDSISGGP